MSIKRNYFYSTIMNAFSVLVTLVSTPYVLRILGPSGYGKFSYAFATMGYFLTVVTTGFVIYATKEIAKIRDNRAGTDRIFTELFMINALLSAASFLFFMAITLLNRKFAADFTLFAVVGLNLLVNMITIDWFYSGVEDYKYLAFRNMALKAAYLALIFIFIRTQSDFIKYAAIGLFTLAMTCALNLANIFGRVKFSFTGLDMRRHAKPIGMMLLLGVVSSMYNKLDTVMLGYMAGAEYTGYYAAARNITGLVSLFIASLVATLFPRLSYYLHNKMQADYGRAAEKAVNFQYFVIFPIVAFFIAFGDEILLLLGGVKFGNASLSLKILSLNILANGLSVFLAYQVLMANNREKLLLLATLPGLAVNLAFNLLMINRLHHVAPSIAIVLTETANVCMMLLVARKFIGFKVFSGVNFTYLFSSAIIAAAAYFLKQALPLNAFAELGGGVLLCGAAYFAWLLAAGDENVKTLLSLFQKYLPGPAAPRREG